MLILNKLLQKTEEKGILLNSFYEARITRIPKLEITRKVNYKTIPSVSKDFKLYFKLSNS